MGHEKCGSGGVGDINGASVKIGTPVIDPDINRVASIEALNAHESAKRQCPVRRRKSLHVVHLPTGGHSTLERLTIPACDACFKQVPHSLTPGVQHASDHQRDTRNSSSARKAILCHVAPQGMKCAETYPQHVNCHGRFRCTLTPNEGLTSEWAK